jgi:diguanylate cyclase (GGDEF)-like protein
MFLDLDNFKPLNDLYGHFMGDLLLIEVANRLIGCVRGVDTVARFGGDEFVVVLSEIGANKAEARAQSRLVAEKVRTTLDKPYVLAHQQGDNIERSVEHRCTASVGVVIFFDNEGSQDDILKWADAAMYKAKELGGNRTQFHAAAA